MRNLLQTYFISFNFLYILDLQPYILRNFNDNCYILITNITLEFCTLLNTFNIKTCFRKVILDYRFGNFVLFYHILNLVNNINKVII